MPLIQIADLARKLQRKLRLTSLPDSVLAAETVAVIVVEDLSEPLADLDRGCQGTSVTGAVAAERTLSALIRVGAPARYDLRVTGVWVNTLATVELVVRRPTAAVLGLTVSAQTSFTDFDIPGRPTSQVGSDNSAAPAAGIDLSTHVVLANTPLFIPLDIRLGIGLNNAVMVLTNTANVALFVSWKWTESAPLG